MSYKDILGEGPSNVPPELLDTDSEDEEPSLVTEDTRDIVWSFLKTGTINSYS